MEPRQVEHKSVKHVDATRILTFCDGTKIETTDEHPFYVEGKGFLAAKEVGIGTSIVTRAGPSLKITKIEAKNEGATVYNFTVEGLHTYFVGNSQVWVHNANCGPTQPPAPDPEIRDIVKPAPRTYDDPRIPGYDQHHLDPPLGRDAPDYDTDVIIDVRNDNSPRKVDGGLNFHTGRDGFQHALNKHIESLGYTRQQWRSLPDATRLTHLQRYYGSLGIPFGK